LPLPGVPLAQHGEILREVHGLGYESVWAGETDRYDAVSLLAATVAWVPELHVGTAVVPAGTRGRAILAMTAAALSDLAPGRVTFGIGASSPLVLRDWNGVEPGSALERVGSTVEYLRAVLSGSRVNGFRLAEPPLDPPTLLVGALGPRMAELGASVADGVVLTALSFDDTRRVIERSPGLAGRRVVVSAPVCPSADADAVRDAFRPSLAMYLNLPAYANLHRWAGRDAVLEPMWDAWAKGDRKAAIRSLPDAVVDDLVVHGAPEVCRARLAEYGALGATDVLVRLEPALGSAIESLRALAP
jgi:probable F420-dependent oxidoreductase